MPKRRVAVVLSRPLSLFVAAGLLVAGLTIVETMSVAAPVPTAGIAIGAGITAYGFVATVAGLGLVRRRRVSWWLGVLAVGAGLLVLIVLIGAARLDPVFGLGIAILAVTLACLLAPATRRSIGITSPDIHHPG
jgi:uncharacterized membrane protein (DUF2068 family)